MRSIHSCKWAETYADSRAALFVSVKVYVSVRIQVKRMCVCICEGACAHVQIESEECVLIRPAYE